MTGKQPRYGLSDPKLSKTFRWLYLPFMFLLGLGSMVLATQRIAAYWNYQPALGKPLFAAFGLPWYAPWSALEWQSRFAPHDAYGFMEQAVTQSQALFLLPQFVILGVWLCFMKKLRSNANLHGSARWAEEDEIRHMGYFGGKGVYVGGWLKKCSGFSHLLRSLQSRPEEVQLYLRHNGPEHIRVFAPTRSGKGVGLILPTLLAWEGSSIVLDIKGENWALTSGWRKSVGQKVLRFDPTDASGASARFNPLEEIRLDTLLAIPDVQNMASMLVDPTGKGLEDHWSKAAFAMLGGALLHCCVMVRHTQQRPATLYDLSCMLADESRSIKQLFEEMVKTDHAALLQELFPQGEGGDKAHVFIASSAREMLNKADNEASGVVSTALTNLSLSCPKETPPAASNPAQESYESYFAE
jgi:type IV secretion system protein VirD4